MAMPRGRARGTVALGLFLAASVGGAALNCQMSDDRPRDRANRDEGFDASGWVMSLGNIHGNPPPSASSVRLSEFLFGVTPEPPLGLIKPSSMAWQEGALWICDSALGAVFRYDIAAGALTPVEFETALQRPVAVSAATNGDLLVADVGHNVVFRFDTARRVRVRYSLESQDFRPASAIEVGNAVWISNVAAHRIEVFDSTSGGHLKSIGRRGSAPSEFGAPLGMAVTPGGNVLVVDMLNDRVQELDTSGAWRRNIGRPGDRVGCFGRPKDVAVSPDGTIFVTDAASQRVHAFDAAGGALTTFGGDGSHAEPLSVPNGVLVTTARPIDARRVAGGPEPLGYVLVAEQLRQPGVRVFAWYGRPARTSADGTAQYGPARRAHLPAPTVENPHWSADKCDACHRMSGPIAMPIAPASVDAACIGCHDGAKAVAESHPVGRIALTSSTTPPADWPLVDGRLGCLTCHDVKRHCDITAARPAANAAMLRGAALGGSVRFCLQCHEGSDSWRISPHQQVRDDGTIREETCGFCHTADSARLALSGGEKPVLRSRGSNVCLGCHSKHWDYFPEGHVDRPLTSEIARRLGDLTHRSSAGRGDERDRVIDPAATSDTMHATPNARAEAGATAENGAAVEFAKSDQSQPHLHADQRLLPIEGGRVVCYTCHNPHQAGLIAAGAPVGRHASLASDVQAHLRMDRQDLCLTCHGK